MDFPLDQPELSVTLDGDSKIRRTVHPSGVRILTETMPGARSATLGYWVPVGSRDEAPTDAGAAGSLGSTHFLEHLLFKGTTSRTARDIAQAFDEVGGEHNALTAKEYTCYYAKVRDQDLSMASSVIADMVTDSVIDPTEFDTERQVILEELAMAEDDPSDVASERLFAAVLGGHPLGRPIGGTPDTILGATRAGVWQHYQQRYQPQSLVIAAAGAVDHDQLVAEVVAALDAAAAQSPQWSMASNATPVDRRPVPTDAVDYPQGDLVEVDRPGAQVNVMLGVPGLISTDPLRYAQSLLNIVLGGGMSSRLFQEIREKRGLAYSTYSFASLYSDAGLFGLYAGCAPEKAGLVTQLMHDEFVRVASDGITEAERTRALGQLAGSSALALEDSDSRMSRLARSEMGAGEFVSLDEQLRRYAEVTCADVQALAARLVSGPLSTVLVGDLSTASASGGVGAGAAVRSVVASW